MLTLMWNKFSLSLLSILSLLFYPSGFQFPKDMFEMAALDAIFDFCQDELLFSITVVHILHIRS